MGRDPFPSDIHSRRRKERGGVNSNGNWMDRRLETYPAKYHTFPWDQ